MLPQLGVILLEGRELGDLRLPLDRVYYSMLDPSSVDQESSHTGLSAVYELVAAVDDMLVPSVPLFPLPISSQSPR